MKLRISSRFFFCCKNIKKQIKYALEIEVVDKVELFLLVDEVGSPDVKNVGRYEDEIDRAHKVSIIFQNSTISLVVVEENVKDVQKGFDNGGDNPVSAAEDEMNLPAANEKYLTKIFEIIHKLAYWYM